MRAPTPTLRTAHRLVWLAYCWMVAGTLLAVAGVVGRLSEWVLWPIAIGAGCTGTLACVVAAITGVGPVRALWRRLAVASGFMSLGTASWAHDALVRTGLGPGAGAPTVMMFLIAVGLAVLALLRLPSRRRSRRATVALWLDIAVVAVASALLATQFMASFALPTRSTFATVGYVLVLGTMAAAVVALIKVSMTGADPVHGPALWTLAPIGSLAPLTFVLSPLIHRWPHLNAIVICLPPAGLLFALAARGQTRVNLTPREPRPQLLPVDRPQPGVWLRSVSVVPYAAVAVTVTMLLVITLHTGYLRPSFVASSMALIILIVIRQLFALADNTELLDRLADQTGHDDLTGLPNRRSFTAALNQRTAATIVAVCDLDGFASLNDRLGDDCGDEILREAAARLTRTVGGGAVVARLLGDEFGILLPERHPLAGDHGQLAESLLNAFRAPLLIDDRDLLVTLTIGLAGGHGDHVPDLLRRAELALQAAQRAGGNRRQEYTAALDAGAEHDAHLAAALRRGLERGEYRLLYQPIVELPSGAVHGVEALVRWHPDGGPAVSPAEFIPVAEHTGLIVDLGRWILETACADAAAWQRRYGADAPWISVNVSPRQLLDPELPAQVADALHRHGLDPRRLTLEITETAVFAGGVAVATVQALRELGTGIALDDFGTGHSSLTLLRTCPVTTLKVDKSFIDGLNGTAQQEAIAASLSGIASTLQLRAVAEGVESEEQATRLHEMGYRYAQGFYFARPAARDQIDALLAAAHTGELSQAS